MKRPLFTVVTPSFNSGDKLARTVASVAAQNLPDWECLVVDGGSADGSRELAEQLAARDPRLRVWSEPDRGVYDAMNKGIRLSRGRYLIFLGAGDVLLPRVLGHVRDALPPHDRGLIYGTVVWYPTDMLYDGPSSRRKLYSRNLPHQGIFYGREVFDLVGHYDLTYHNYADWALNIRCFGDYRVVKWYLPLLVAGFELGGVSTAGDPAFMRDRDALYRRHIGRLRFAWAKFLGRRRAHLAATPCPTTAGEIPSAQSPSQPR